MNRPTKFLAAGIGIVLAGSVVLLLLGMREPEQRVCEVVQDGKVLYTFDLNTAEDQTLRINAKNGSYNIITIEAGEIFVSEAGCPDQVCVRAGMLRTEGMPVVCLPNRLVIRFAAGGAS